MDDRNDVYGDGKALKTGRCYRAKKMITFDTKAMNIIKLNGEALQI